MVSSSGLLAGLVLALVLIGYTFWPEGVFAAQRDKTRLEFLRERREQLQENLRDLAFEFQAGKYPAEDYAAQERLMETELSAVQAEMEAFEKAGAVQAGEGAR